MDLEQTDESHRYEYIKWCSCGNQIKLLTQEDRFPEYHTDVYVECQCGQYLLFQLPVN